MNRLLGFCGGYIYEDEIFFSSMELNGLFKKSKKTGEVKLLGIFEQERCFEPILHSKVIESNRKLYFIPAYGCGISIYDLETATFDYILIKENNSELLYVDAVKNGDKWLLIPSFLGVEFALLDPYTNKVELCPKINIALKRACKEWKQGIDFSSVKIRGKNLYIPFYDTGCIVEYNLQNDDIREIYIEGKHFSKVELDGENIWATTLSGEIDRIDIKNGNYKEYNIVKSTKREFSTCIKWNDRLFLIPSINNSLWEYDYNMDCWKNLAELSEIGIECKEGNSRSMYLGYFALDDELLVFPIAANAGIGINTLSVSAISYEYDEDCEKEIKNKYREMMDNQMGHSKWLLETSSFDLEKFLWLM